MSSTIGPLAMVAALLVGACRGEESVPHATKHRVEAPSAASVQGVEIDPRLLARYAPLPAVVESKVNPITDDKVALGRMLFYDTRLSKDHDVSCNTCHDLDRYGIDGKDVPSGHKGRKGRRNSPTVYNATLEFTEGWDGRAETVEAQAKAHVLNPAEMAMPSSSQVLGALQSVPEYVEAFKRAFPDDARPMTFDNFAKALGAFERNLVTPARWDLFLTGDHAALTDDEKKGFLKFVDTGCVACHVGPLVGGTMFEKLGSMIPWPNQTDKGRAEVTKSPTDEMVFKVSQLRNIEHTAPYSHDASARTLEQAVKMMALYQLNKELTDDDTESIVTWLKTLSGAVPFDYVKKPDLPESVSKLPRPK